ncbi:MAG: ABC transporter substrate-binding protein [Gammaproteobacteria bacterium]|nr:ABC transporter substrate-binding protein [Gammaproteobacteria bacterium]
MKSTLRTSLTVAAVLFLAPALSTAKTVKVGLVLTFTGGAARFGQQIERGMNLYLKQHGDTFGGHDVEVIKRDSKRPGGDIAKNAVRDLITRDRVDLLTGFVFSPNAIASAPLVTQGKVPMVIMNAATAWIPNLSPYIARVSFTMWQAGMPMGDYAKRELACTTAASGYTDYPPGKDSVAAFKTGFEGAGGKVVDQIPMGGPREVPDFTPFFQRVKDARPDCFYVFVPAGNHAIAVVKAFADLGLAQAGIRLIGPGDINPDTTLQDMGDAAVGLTTIHHYSADYDTKANFDFVTAWKEAYGADTTPDFMGVAGWDGMAAIAHVIKTLDGNIEAEAAMDALRGWKFNSPRGPIEIDAETRDIVHDQHVHVVVRKGDRFGIDVVKTFKAVKDPCKALKMGKCGQ